MTRSKAGKLGDFVRVIIAEPAPGSRADAARSNQEEEE
jgi:hypothetical protein